MNKCWHVTKDRDDSTVLRENLCSTDDDLLQLQPTTGLHAGLVGPGLGSGLRKCGEGVDVRTGDFHGELTQPFCQNTQFSEYISYNPQSSKFNPQASLPLYFCLKQQGPSEVLLIGQLDVLPDTLCFRQGPGELRESTKCKVRPGPEPLIDSQ